jgi:cobalt-zinc-cadmium resistance protein CzcA
MLERFIDLVFRNRLLVVIGFVLVSALGGWRMYHTAVDAFPDTTPIQVQVNAVAPSLNPTEIEQQLTLPLELAISGLPGLDNVRSISKFGFAQIVAIFDDGTDIYDARQLVMERVAGVSLPPGIGPPTLGPIATGLGEIFHYTLSSTSPDRTLDELRTLHDWVVKPELRKIAGSPSDRSSTPSPRTTTMSAAARWCARASPCWCTASAGSAPSTRSAASF